MMNRKDFIEKITGRTQSNLAPLSGLNPYTGPWTKTQAQHLLRRTLFGVKKTDIDGALAAGMNASVNSLLNASLDPLPSPPLNIYSTTALPDPEVPYGSTWINAPAIPGATLPVQYIQSRKDSFKIWWTGNILLQKTSIVEKLTVFWFNHFSIELDQIPIAQPVYYYYKMLRENCLGDFRKMLKSVTIDPTMLFYLNGQKNSATAPDENYGRELQELFTMGKGVDSKYTEDDVKAAAKVLTGIRINPLVNPLTNYYDLTQHDFTVKTFSAFYNNKSISFKTSLEQEVDDLLNMLTSNTECARFLCRKLYQFFVYYEISPEVENNIIIPLSDFMRSNNYDIRATLDKLLKSEHFYDVANLGCVIKNPFDYAVGLFKEFSVALPDSSNPQLQYFGWAGVTILTAYQGMNIADPPVVSGYQPWYQAPQYHEIWINSDTLASRNNVAASLFTAGGLDVNGIKYFVDPFVFTKTFSTPENASLLVKEAVSRLYNYPISDVSIDYLKSFLISGLPDETYWTTIWLEYIANPNDPNYKSAASNRLYALYSEIVSQAEYHLS